ncbi:lytic polysaccharide monooxygenase auxiliary activity family 9 protein [Nocardia sp. NPDC052254]|uniref:lytic polysaccharide monooxygenase auxiliary activity family 9 protein n=1 Tax=Nocardia sp. NPDC052254 TaxID=3155681 RepID=UPI00342BB3E1
MHEWIAYELEAMKFFPATQGGLTDRYRPEDQPSDSIPGRQIPDGRIASAGRGDARNLDRPGSSTWTANLIEPGASITIRWSTRATHKVRRFNYFCTHPQWNPEEPLSRRHFHQAPLDPVVPDNRLGYIPADACRPFTTFASTVPNYWDPDSFKPFADGGMTAADLSHTITLPDRLGYHVLLGVCEVADTGMAFYTVVDMNIG